MTKLHIATGFTLPLDAQTQTFAVLAKRRVGKTYTASVMAEEFVAAGLPFVVLDPTGAWWGLRASADGKSEGLPVVIIGGGHGDVPLEATAGKVIADLVVEHPGFYIIDTSGTESDAEQDRFATDFASQLYRLKEKHRDPLHLFVDEADLFAPQRPFPNQTRMLGAFEALVRRGGIRGIGLTLITQRPAVLNKNVLTQTECLIVLQMTAPQDQDAIDDWVKRNGTKEQRDTMMASLASLKKGEAWIWSPSWLEMFKRVQIRERRTFNSSATPRAGEKQMVPQRLAPVDLAKLKDRIASTIEQAKADDPKELRKQIAELQQQLRGAQSQPKVETKIERVEVPVLTNKQVEQLVTSMETFINFAREVINNARDIQRLIETAAKSSLTTKSVTDPKVVSPIIRQPFGQHDSLIRQDRPGGGTEVKLDKARRAILTVLAQYPNGRTLNQVAILSGYAIGTGGFNNAISALRSSRFIHGDKGNLQITSDGAAALGQYDPLPTGQDLIAYWQHKLGKAERSAFDVLVNIYPQAMHRDDLAQSAGYTPGTGGINNALSRLRTLELATGRVDMKANDTLFE